MTDKEKLAQWMIERGYATGHGDTIEDLIEELVWQVVERERKRMLSLIRQLHDVVALESERRFK